MHSAEEEVKVLSQKIAELEKLVQTISLGKYMWESTFDAISDPVLIVTQDYKVARANLAAAKNSGSHVRELIGQNCFEKFAGFEKPCVGCPLQKSIQTSAPQSCELKAFKNGGKRYQVQAYPLQHAHEEVSQTILYYRDVTEEKALQQQLLHSEKMAAVGTLAGGVAHEINNPLGGILAFTQLVLRDLGREHSSYTDLKHIEEATLRCKKIVQDLLDFSRKEREEEMTSVDINEVIGKVVPLVAMQAKAVGVQIIAKLAEGMPPVRGHVHKLQQIFLNLLNNACQATKNGGDVVIATRLNGGSVQVIVSDKGVGISPDIIGKIFDPYFTTKPQGEGTGLGLSITYGLVREHQGIIDVKSSLGQGTTFTVELPVL